MTTKYCTKCLNYRSTENASGTGRQYRCGVCTLARLASVRKRAEAARAALGVTA